MSYKIVVSAVVAFSLIGSIVTASAQAGGANGAGAATAPGSDVKAGEQDRPSTTGAPNGPATTGKEIRDESQYTIGDKKGRGPGEKPDAVEAAPAGR